MTIQDVLNKEGMTSHEFVRSISKVTLQLAEVIRNVDKWNNSSEAYKKDYAYATLGAIYNIIHSSDEDE